MRVLVCGSRDWTDAEMIETFLEGMLVKIDLIFETLAVVDGGARGADQMAGRWADDGAIPRYSYPADWQAHGKAAGPIRNRRMLDEAEPDIVLAFKDDFDWQYKRGGTEHMVRISKAAGVPTYVVSHA